MKGASRLFLFLSFLYSLCILLLGGWWLYLIVEYGEKLEQVTGLKNAGRVLKMVKWEGATFFTLLILLSASLLFLYFRDHKKTKALQSFFAGMTHELKTPLASIRLQAEVLESAISKTNEPSLKKLMDRLIEDTNKMENQMDKILQLSRLEGGGDVGKEVLNIKELIERGHKRWASQLTLDLQSSGELVVADEFALSMIFRNLFENTIIHTNQKTVAINVTDDQGFIELYYNDAGKFNGEYQKLGTLFYKYNSSKGSGIGLFLIKSLVRKMKGEFKILEENNQLTFCLKLPKALGGQP